MMTDAMTSRLKPVQPGKTTLVAVLDIGSTKICCVIAPVMRPSRIASICASVRLREAGHSECALECVAITGASDTRTERGMTVSSTSSPK